MLFFLAVFRAVRVIDVLNNVINTGGTMRIVHDMLINEKLSGGQKSRLILWTRGYNVDQNHKEIIILDEPCPDVDFDGYVDNLKRFYKKYQHCAILLIGHLCDCKRKSLEINFNLELWIEDGIIKKLI